MQSQVFLKLCAAIITLSFVTIATTQVLGYRLGKQPRDVKIVESVPISVRDVRGIVSITADDPITVKGDVDVSGTVNVDEVYSTVEVKAAQK